MAVDSDENNVVKNPVLEDLLVENHRNRAINRKVFFAAFFKIFSGMLFMYCFSYVAIPFAEVVFLGDKGSFLMGVLKMIEKEVLIIPLWVIGLLFIIIINYYVLFHDRSSEG